MSQSATPSIGTSVEIDDRTRRAAEQDILVHDAKLRFDAFGDLSHIEFVVINNNPSTDDGPTSHTVMVSANGFRVTGCSCEDMAYHSPEGGCKHMRYVDAVIGVAFHLIHRDGEGDLEERYAGLRELVGHVKESDSPEVVAEMANLTDRVIEAVDVVGKSCQMELDAAISALQRATDAE